MTFLLKDRVRETSTTTGTGNFTLSGTAPSGSQSFGAAYTVGDTLWYAVIGGVEWESGLGTYSALNTLTRTTVFESSNANAAVSFSAGTKDVFVDLPASKTSSLFSGGSEHSNCTLAVSASAGALTIALKDVSGNDPSAANPCIINFRSATGTTGTTSALSVTAATSVVISSGSTLGVTSSTAFRIWVVGFNDGGTFRLGAINCTTYSAGAVSVYPLDDSVLESSTAEGGAGAADSAGVIYTGTAVTAKASRILGYIEWDASGVTAGTWATANLAKVQAFGPGVHKPGDVMPRGVYQANSAITTTSTSFTSTGYAVTFTPRSAANPISLSVSAGCDSSAVGNTIFLDLNRGATSLAGVFGTTALSSAAKQGTSAGVIPQSFAIHDRPNTTSSVTYTLNWSTTSGTATLGARNGGLNTQPTVFSAAEIMG